MDNRKLISLIVILSLLSLSLGSCDDEEYIPKPRGFFRIEIPQHQYRILDSIYPYTFEYPTYAVIQPDRDPNAEPYWINVEFPEFKGTLHLSYKRVNKNVKQYFEDARSFVTKHIPKADDIEPDDFANDSARVWGLVYHIQGTGVASAYQFCVTDSTQHFLRGALYFDAVTNNDSLAPVLDFITADLDHMLKTLKWKNAGKMRLKD